MYEGQTFLLKQCNRFFVTITFMLTELEYRTLIGDHNEDILLCKVLINLIMKDNLILEQQINASY